METYLYKLEKHFLNSKESMKFYIDKEVYDLFDFCVVYRNSFSFEFFTLNKSYKRIYNYFKHEFDARLRCCEWDINYDCYCVDFSCVQLLVWLDHWYNRPWISSGEKGWKDMARDRGWVDEEELHEGWLEYKRRIDRWFKLNY